MTGFSHRISARSLLPRLVPCLAILLLTLPVGACSPSPTEPKWTTYSDAHHVADMAFDAAGHLWTAGDGGGAKWNPQQDTATRYTVDDGLASNRVLAVVVASDLRRLTYRAHPLGQNEEETCERDVYP